MNRLPSQMDVFVVGGGPAGLAAALAVRQQGLSVIVADRAQPPLDKACGEGLLPDGIAALRRIGVEFDTDDGASFRGIRFIDGERTAEASFPVDHGIGMRRTRLHQVLQEHAEKAGVLLHWQARVDAINQAGVIVDGQAVGCRWVIGADGIHSRVRKWAGLQPIWNGARRFGIRQHFRIQPWTDLVEVYWSKGCQAYVTPVGPTEVCVVLIGSEPGSRLDPRRLFPTLGRYLGSAEIVTPSRGALSMSVKMGAVTRGRIALVGDASGSVDAVTGDGLSLAFRQAGFLAAALAADNLHMYEAAHRRLSRMPRLTAQLLLLMDQNDGFRRRVISTLAARPRTFNRFLAAHVGSLGATNLLLEAIGFALRLIYQQACKGLAHKLTRIFMILMRQWPTTKKTISTDNQETEIAILTHNQ